MSFIDRQGRLFGRLSMIDLGVVVFLVFLAPLTHYAHRSMTTVEIWRVEPQRLSNKEPAKLVISGRNFDRASRVLIAGSPIEPVWFVNHRWLEVTLPARFQAGRHPVTVTGPQGRSGTWEDSLVVVEPSLLVVESSGVAPAGSLLPAFADVFAVFAFEPSVAHWLEPDVRGGRDGRNNPTLQVIDMLVWNRGLKADPPRSALQADLQKTSEGKRLVVPRLMRMRGRWVLATLRLIVAVAQTPPEGGARFFYRHQPLAPGLKVNLEMAGREVESYLLSWPAIVSPQPSDLPAK